MLKPILNIFFLLNLSVTAACNLNDNSIQGEIGGGSENGGSNDQPEEDGASSVSPTLGKTWNFTQVFGIGPYVDDINTLTYQGGYYYSSGDNGMIRSADGVTWNPHSTFPLYSGSQFEKARFLSVNGNWFAVDSSNNIFVSSDNFNTWSNYTIDHSGPQINSIAFGAGRYVAATQNSGAKIYSSADLVTWDLETNVAGGSVRSMDVIFADGLFVVASHLYLESSPDGINWTDRTPGSFCHWYDLVYEPSIDTFVAAGGCMVSSSNGTSWTNETVGGGLSGYIYSVCYNNNDNQFVGVGSGGVIISSADGTNWVHQTADGGYTGWFLSVVYAKGLFVAVGFSGEIQTSPDGITWTHRNADAAYTGAFIRLHFSNGIFIAVGTGGEIQTSPDGITWTHRNPANAFAGNIWDINFVNNDFYIVGAGGEIQSSADTITWTSHTTGNPSSEDLNAVEYCGAYYVAAGNNGVILRSDDGINWEDFSISGSYKFLDLLCLNGEKLIVVGENAKIYISD